MKHSLQMKRWLRRLLGEPQVRPATRAERGQALVVIAVAMIGLLAFVGLTVDAGILFIGEGHLRRAVDAAALAAAGQFRVGRTHPQLAQSADEVVHMNGVDPNTLVLTVCDPTDPAYDEPTVHPGSTMCAGSLHRKLVKVVATTHVTFAFLGIIGFPGTDITADATSEAASLDVVLVIDTSNSMTFDAAPGDPMRTPATCNAAANPDPSYVGDCQPFDNVKHAAVDFISHLYWPYDRLAIVTFDNVPTVPQPLTNTLTLADWQTAVKNLVVSPPRDPPFPGCTFLVDGDPSGCTNTSTGGGLFAGGSEFGRNPIRQEAVWVVILLTDGAANASQPTANSSKINEFCPPSTWSLDAKHYDPFCRDADKTTRHTQLNPTVWGVTHTVPYNPLSTYDSTGGSYDADDYARDGADFVACSSKLATAALWCRDSLNYNINKGGQGALIYAIGLGNLVIDNSQGGGEPGSSPEVRIDPNGANAAKAGYDAGDYLLRYIANVGLDGNPDPSIGPDACQGVAAPHLNFDPIGAPNTAPTISPGNLSYNCGNYFFSQTGTGLTSVFQSIESRIFTRITQ